jgi:hypothetical protein
VINSLSKFAENHDLKLSIMNCKPIFIIPSKYNKNQYLTKKGG